MGDPGSESWEIDTDRLVMDFPAMFNSSDVFSCNWHVAFMSSGLHDEVSLVIDVTPSGTFCTDPPVTYK